MFRTLALKSSVILFFFALISHGSALRDQALQAGLQALTPLQGKNSAIYQLGERLFFDNALSGNKNISCASCHHPSHYSGDGLMLGLGQGAEVKDGNVWQAKGEVLKRHSPHLINIGFAEFSTMFWDGRLSYSASSNTYKTPEPKLNGENPEFADIIEPLNGALSAQALFPLTSRAEMRGHRGQNELADAKSNKEIWHLVVQRVLAMPKYQQLLNRAFPEKELSEINIGHLGQAIAHFQTFFFMSTETPYDRFLRGEESAMSALEKKGLEIFINKGNCTHCHGGPHLTNFTFQSVGAPQILSPSFDDDTGREEAHSKSRNRYKFKVPALRNISLTGPYFHSGAFRTVEQVVEHYNSIGKSLRLFEIDSIWQNTYSTPLTFDSTPSRNELRVLQARPTPIRIGLQLNPDEKAALAEFLRTSLTDEEFKQRMDSYRPKN